MTHVHPKRSRPIVVTIESLRVSSEASEILDLDLKGGVNDIPLWADGKLGPWRSLVTGKDITANLDATLGKVKLAVAGSAEDLAEMNGVEATFNVGGNEPISRETIRDLITGNGYDAVLLTRVLDSSSEIEVKPGSAAAKVTRRDDRPVDFFRYDYEELDEPGTIEVRTDATRVSELYRAADESLVWSIEISSAGADNVGEVIDEVAAKVVNRLRRDRRIAK